MSAQGVILGSVGISTLFGCLILLMALLNDRGKPGLPTFDAHESNVARFSDDASLLGLDKAPLVLRNSEWRFTDFDAGYMSCRDLPQLFSQARPLGAGHTKSVFLSRRGDGEVAVKIANIAGVAFDHCVHTSQQTNLSRDDCYGELAQSLLHELRHMMRFSSRPHIVQLYGYCIPALHPLQLPRWDAIDRLAIVVEAGKPVELIPLLQLDWTQRIKLLQSLTKILSELDAVAVSDFRRQQFVFANDDTTIKLIDLDSLSATEPRCGNDIDCCTAVRQHLNTNAECTLINCRQGTCQGYNYLHNLQRSFEVFFSKLLPYSVPKKHQENVEDLFVSISRLNTTVADLQLSLKNLQLDSNERLA